MRGANRNVILSHGGKHGQAAGTYLKNTVVPGQAAPHVPARLLTEVTGENPGQHGSRPADSAKAPQVQTPATKAAPVAKAAVPVAPPVPANVPVHRVVTTPEASDEPPAGPVTIPEAPEAVTVSDAPQRAPEAVEEADPLDPEAGEPQAGEIEMPNSKRQLARMSKADAYALAVELGLEVPTNPDDILSSDLKSKLSDELGL